MSNRVATLLPSHPVSEYTEGGVALANGASEQLGEVTAAPAVSDAHRAVEVVLHAVDRVARREQSAVKLEFSVGDAELVVRVERHANEVRATFRTDSPELRAALAQEWQAVTGAASDRGGRASSATFAGLEQAPQESLSGDASSSRQHERQPARSHDQPASAPAFARATSAGATVAPSFTSVHPASSLAPAGTALRLNLFA